MNELNWQDGIGFLPFNDNPVPYDEAYFLKYQGLARTGQGKYITQLRANLVEAHAGFCKPEMVVLDVGIGCGCFIQAMRLNGWDCKGTDINPVAIKWLEHKNLLWKEGDKATILTFWDVLEHIPDPSSIFDHHKAQFVFVSMPIFRDKEHVLRSKHFKPGEHCWYFTHMGLESFMARQGYQLTRSNKMETDRGGREDIGSFVFRRMVA